jgi:hypothetical protein
MTIKRRKRAPRKQRLQELTIKKARPEAKTYLIWDSKQAHLALQVQPTGSKAFKVIYSRHGRPRWYHIGDASVIGLADARTLAAEAMLAVARGKDPAAEKKAERGAGTFAELAAKGQVCRAVGEEAQQVVAPGRGPRQPLRHAALGQAAGLDYHPR